MSVEVPSDWEKSTLGAVSTVKARIGWRGLSSNEYTSSGPFLIAGKHIRDGVINWGRCDHLSEFRYDQSPEIQLQEGDVILSKDGSIGNPALISCLPGPATINGTMMLVRAQRERLDPAYLYQVVRGNEFARMIREKVSGSSIPHIFQRDIVHFPVALPPLDEQRRIAEVLRSMDEAIAAADGVARQWAKTCETLLDAAFAEGEPATLGDICSLIYRYPGFYGFDQLETGVPVIRGEHLRAGRISRDWADFYFVDPAFSARFPKTILELDDVVMSVRGTVGTTAVVDAAHVGSQISPNLIRLVADPTKIVPPLLYYAVQSAVAHMRRTIVNAQALPAINAGDLKQVEIALPPLADQAALLAELNGAAAARADAVSAAQQARQTKAVLMYDLLSGRVRVPA